MNRNMRVIAFFLLLLLAAPLHAQERVVTACIVDAEKGSIVKRTLEEEKLMTSDVKK